MTQNDKTAPNSNSEALQVTITLEHKKRAITAGLVVEVDPDEADRLGISGMDSLNPADPMSAQIEQELMESRFDACEFDFDTYQIASGQTSTE